MTVILNYTTGKPELELEHTEINADLIVIARLATEKEELSDKLQSFWGYVTNYINLSKAYNTDDRDQIIKIAHWLAEAIYNNTSFGLKASS